MSCADSKMSKKIKTYSAFIVYNIMDQYWSNYISQFLEKLIILIYSFLAL